MRLAKPKVQYQNNHLKRILKSPTSQHQFQQRQMFPIYEVDEVHTEEVMLPYNSNPHLQLLQKCNSELLNDKNKGIRLNQLSSYEISPSNFYQQLQEFKAKQSLKHPNLTRQNIQQINRKQRSIRCRHYKRNSTGMIADVFNTQNGLSAGTPILTAKEVNLSNQKILNRKNIMSSQARRAIDSIIRSDEMTNQPKRATSHQQMRGETKSRVKSSSKSQAAQMRLHNPLVIYPFQTKLKLRRVDDNPKILGSILRKKIKQMQKEDLYMYINGIVHRKSK